MTEALAQWVQDKLEQKQNLPADIALEPLSGDAGFRRYFKVNGVASHLLAVFSPPETEKNRAFLDLASCLREAGVMAPEVFSFDLEKGFFLLEDFGQTHMLDVLTPETAGQYYQQAFQSLLKMQAIETSAADLQPYDEEVLLGEMSLFPEWFVSRLLGCGLESSEQAMLSTLFERLTASALQQPRVFVHRDFHSRNLLAGNTGLGVIDFQDALKGPLTYDLVSLLRDCYVCWHPLKVEGWLEAFYQIMDADLRKQVGDFAHFREYFDLMGLQRHLKVLGIFARLYLRDGKPGYLGDLPLVIHYVRTVAADYPQYFAAFTGWFDEALMPLIEKQDWYFSFEDSMPADGWKRK